MQDNTNDTTTRDFDALRWHLTNNFQPRHSQAAIDGMIETIKRFDNGEIEFSDEIVSGSDVTVEQLFEDLRIEPLN